MKKTQKTKESQYDETDEHPFQSKQISHGGVVLNVYAIPNVYLTFTVKTQSNYLSADIKELRYEKNIV